MIFKGEMMVNNKKDSFSTKDAVAYMHDLTLTKQQMRTTKSYLASKNVMFPNTNQLLEMRKSLRPNINSELDNTGVSVDYTELVTMTTTSLLNVIENAEKIDLGMELTVMYKDGGDTAGSQTVWKSAEMTDVPDHLFQYSLVPILVEQGVKTLWKNPSPNSATLCRPIYLPRASEDEAHVIDLVFPTTDQHRTHLENYTMESGKEYTVQHKIHDTMKDLKLKKKLSGIGGGDCILCGSRKADWKDVEKIKEGFPITRDAEETRALFEQLMVEQYARTSSPILQLIAAMCRLLERSDPGILQHQIEMKNQLKCEECGMKHKTKNHQKYAQLIHQTVLNEYDSLVTDFFLG